MSSCGTDHSNLSRCSCVPLLEQATTIILEVERLGGSISIE